MNHNLTLGVLAILPLVFLWACATGPAAVTAGNGQVATADTAAAAASTGGPATGDSATGSPASGGGQAGGPAATYRNPVLRGMNPDPSICRVGDDFYLVTSTFEYFPGLPIYHSKDLVHWRLIGHALNRPANAPLLGAAAATGGNYAPTLRYHDGTFYIACTNYGGQGSRGVFYVTAANPAGPWSDPVWMNQWYVDPSMSFDDGVMYWLTPDNKGSFLLGTWDPVQEDWVQFPELIGKGMGGSSPEGPHLYKIKGRYYLMSAEGGTGYQHREVIQRSDNPWGPYEASPMGPVLSNHKKTRHPIQAIGHADLVELADGSWWAVCLGIRPVAGSQYHHLGRETFLAPVTWSADGWPRVEPDGIVETSFKAPNLPSHPWPAEAVRDDFASDSLGLQWNFVRNPDEATWSLTARPGALRLLGPAHDFDTKDSPAFVGRRQTEHAMTAATRLDFVPARDGEEAGLVVRATDVHHYDLVLTRQDGQLVVLARTVVKGEVKLLGSQPVAPGPLVLSVAADAKEYRFMVQEAGKEAVQLGKAGTRDLSTEVAGGFTGVFLGMYATGNGEWSTAPADFDWFDYQPAGTP